MPRFIAANGVAALLVASAAAPARAEDVPYTFTCTVTAATNPSGPWAGVRPGDPLRLCLLIDALSPPTSSTPTSRTFQFPDSFACYPAYLVAGSARAEFRFGNAFVESGEFTIADDDPTLHDAFTGVMHTERHGDIAVDFLSPGSALADLDWPSAAELDPSRWALATVRITGDFGQGPVAITASVDLVISQDINCWRIDYTEDGLIDFGDYLEFLGYYDIGDSRADLCGCGLVDFMSYLLFLEAYDGCGGG